MVVNSWVVLLLYWLMKMSDGAVCQFGGGCLYSCHCKDDVTCDNTSGECPDGCDDGSPSSNHNSGPWHGPACQIGNIAHGKSASQCGTTDNAGLGVDGRLDPSVSLASPSCSNEDGTSYAWWQVDLGRPHYISSVTIYNRNDCCQENLWTTVIELGTKSLGTVTQCGNITDSTDPDYNTVTDMVTKQCVSPGVADFIKLRRDAGSAQPGQMSFVELFAEGFKVPEECPGGLWGPGCLRSCLGCAAPCDPVTGICNPPVCLPGWQGSNCEKECDNFTWGMGCAQHCNCRSSCEICRKVDGGCPNSGCSDLHIGTACEIRLADLSGVRPEYLNKTQTSIGIRFHSDQGADSALSYYVAQYRLAHSSHWISTNVYEHTTHTPQIDFVFAGLNPETLYAIRVMPVYDEGLVLRTGQPSQDLLMRTSGCWSGYWGSGCQYSCHKCSRPCDVTTEACYAPCLPGYTGSHCHIGCNNMWWGQDCQYRCNCQVHTEVCGKQDGICRKSGCPDGYEGPACQIHLSDMSGIEIEFDYRSSMSIAFHFMAWKQNIHEGILVDYYLVRFRPVNSTFWLNGQTIPYDADVHHTSVNVVNLEPDKEYVFQVMPVYDDGLYVRYGLPTMNLEQYTEGLVDLSAFSLEYLNRTATTITVLFQPWNSTADTQTHVSYYQVQYLLVGSTEGTPWQSVLTLTREDIVADPDFLQQDLGTVDYTTNVVTENSTDTTTPVPQSTTQQAGLGLFVIKLTSLTPDLTYRIRVVPVFDDGQVVKFGIPTPELFQKTQGAAYLDDVKLVFSNRTTNTISFHFTPFNSTLHWESHLDYYRVQYQTELITWTDGVQLPHYIDDMSEIYVTVDKLEPNTEYTLRLIAMFDDSFRLRYGGPSQELVASTEGLASLLWHELELDYYTSTSISFHFQPWNTTKDPTGHVMYYLPEYRPSGTTDWLAGVPVNHYIDAEIAYSTIENMEPNVEYTIQVVPVYDDGQFIKYGTPTPTLTQVTEGLADLSEKIIEPVNQTATSLAFRFQPWNSTEDPTRHVMYYLPQYRISDVTEWLNAVTLDHKVVPYLYVNVVDLEVEKEYAITVIPVYDDGMFVKHGEPTPELLQNTQGLAHLSESHLELVNRSALSLEFSFQPWDTITDPTRHVMYYLPQYRTSESTVWLTTVAISHLIGVPLWYLDIKYLEVDIEYTLRVVPVYSDGTYLKHGVASSELLQLTEGLADLSGQTLQQENRTDTFISFHFLPFDTKLDPTRHVMYYLPQYRNSNATEWLSCVTILHDVSMSSMSSMYVNIQYLEPNTEYTLQVVPVYDDGNYHKHGVASPKMQWKTEGLADLSLSALILDVRTPVLIAFHFEPWDSILDSTRHVMYYLPQYRPLDETGWLNGTSLDHEIGLELINVTVIDLEPDMEYVFHMIPVYDDGVYHKHGLKSQELTTKTEGIANLSGSAIEMVNRNSTSISLQFQPWNTTLDPTRHVMYYLPQYHTSNATEWLNGTILDHQIDWSYLSIVIVHLEPDTEYAIHVVPVYDDGNYVKLGVPTSELTNKTEGLADLSTRTMVLEAITATSITYSFQPWNTTADPTRHVMYYLPQYRKPDSFDWLNGIILDHGLDNITVEVDITNLWVDEVYICRVIPVYDDRYFVKHGVPSSEWQQKTEGLADLSNSPVTFEPSTVSTITFYFPSWDTFSNPGTHLTGYLVQYWFSNDTDWLNGYLLDHPDSQTSMQVEIPDLQVGVQYLIRIVPVYDGDSYMKYGQSSPEQLHSTEGIVDLSGEALKFENRTVSSIAFHFKPLDRAVNPTQHVDGYLVQFHLLACDKWVNWETIDHQDIQKDLHAEIHSLEADGEYVIRVIPVYDDGFRGLQGNPSPDLHIKTQGVADMSSTTLSLDGMTPTSIAFHFNMWDPITQPDKHVTGYLMQLRYMDTTNWLNSITVKHIDNTQHLNVNLTNLVSYTQYIIQVVPVFDDGLTVKHGPASQVLMEKTSACVAGWWGAGCEHQCGQCASPCHTSTGRCPTVCQPGWKGSSCNTECDDYTWGQNCSKHCNCLDNAEVCLKVNGSCPLSGCPNMYRGEACQLRLLDLSSMNLNFVTRSSTSITFNFEPWDRVIRGSRPNTRYLTQYRNAQTTVWKNGVSLNHDDDIMVYAVSVTHLQSDNEYIMRVMPLYDDGHVVEEGKHSAELIERSGVCPIGTWGPGCFYSCNRCSTACNQLTGACPVECLPGWSGTFCNLGMVDLSYTMLELDDRSPTSVSFHFTPWDSTLDPDRYVTYYQPQYHATDSTEWQDASTTYNHQQNQLSVPVTVTGLEPGIPYIFQVIPVYEDEATKDYGMATPELLQNTEGPADLSGNRIQVVNKTATTIGIQFQPWNTASVPTRHVTYYLPQYRTTDASEWQDVAQIPHQSDHLDVFVNIVNLEANKQYFIHVVPVYDDGGSFIKHGSSTTDVIEATEDFASLSADELDLVNRTATSITFSFLPWDSVQFPTRHVMYYLPQYRTIDSMTWEDTTSVNHQPGDTVLLATVSDLVPDTEYVSRVLPMFNDGTQLKHGSPSPVLQEKTEGFVDLSGSILEMTARSGTSITFRFQTEETAADPSKHVMYYLPQYQTTDSAEWTTGMSLNHQADQSSVHVTFTGLVPDTEYVFRVVPVYDDGTFTSQGAASPELLQKTIGLYEMSTTTIQLHNRTASSLTFQFKPWNSTLDPSRHVTYYLCQFRTTNTAAWTNGPTVNHDNDQSTLLVSISDLEPDIEFAVHLLPVYDDGMYVRHGKASPDQILKTEGLADMSGTVLQLETLTLTSITFHFPPWNSILEPTKHVTDYLAQYRTAENSAWQDAETVQHHINGSDLHISVYDLEINSQYMFHVVPVYEDSNFVKHGPATPDIMLRTAGMVDLCSTELLFESRSATSISFHFQPWDEELDPNRHVTEYLTQYRMYNATVWTDGELVKHYNDDITIHIGTSGLILDVWYVFHVVPVYNAGSINKHGNPSMDFLEKTDGLVDLSGSEIQLVSRSASSIQFDFESLDTSQNPSRHITGYLVQHHDLTTTFWVDGVTLAQPYLQHTFTVDLTGLVADMAYIIRVVPVYDDGNGTTKGKSTPEVFFSTQGVGELSETPLVIEGYTSTSISFTFAAWNQLEHPTKHLSGYLVQYQSTGPDDWTDGAIHTHTHGQNQLTVQLTSLLSDTLYLVRIVPVYDDGSNTKQGHYTETLLQRTDVCPPGTWGSGCNILCGHCPQSCDKSTGECTIQCLPGWKGLKCDTECSDLTWGPGCIYTCNCKITGEVCEKTDGKCPTGCSEWSVGYACELDLADLSLTSLNLINKTSTSLGINFKPWDKDLHGNRPKTSYLVQYRSQDSSDWQNGVALEHSNDLSWYFVNVSGLHPDTQYGVKVISVYDDGRIVKLGKASAELLQSTAVCPGNKWGPGCANSCNQCSGLCDQTTGVCLSYCLPGWHGNQCDSVCSSRTWGPGCQEQCNKCSEPCDSITGQCTGSCLPGWTGTNCQTECADFTWGLDCSKQCNCNNPTEVCVKLDGSCPFSGCPVHHYGTPCDKRLVDMSSTILNLLNSTDQSIAFAFVSWDTTQNTNSPITYYLVQYSLAIDSVWLNALIIDHHLDGSFVHVNMQDLEPFMFYAFHVVPVYDDGSVAVQGIQTTDLLCRTENDANSVIVTTKTSSMIPGTKPDPIYTTTTTTTQTPTTTAPVSDSSQASMGLLDFIDTGMIGLCIIVFITGICVVYCQQKSLRKLVKKSDTAPMFNAMQWNMNNNSALQEQSERGTSPKDKTKLNQRPQPSSLGAATGDKQDEVTTLQASNPAGRDSSEKHSRSMRSSPTSDKSLESSRVRTKPGSPYELNTTVPPTKEPLESHQTSGPRIVKTVDPVSES